LPMNNNSLHSLGFNENLFPTTQPVKSETFRTLKP